MIEYGGFVGGGPVVDPAGTSPTEISTEERNFKTRQRRRNVASSFAAPSGFNGQIIFSALDVNQPMPRQTEAGFGESGLPAGFRADGGRVFQQAVAFFRLSQSLELREQRMRRREERFLAMQHRRVVALPVVVEVELP